MKTEIYKDDDGEWRWTVTAKNNEIIGASTEGYKNHADALSNLSLLCEALGVWKPSKKKEYLNYLLYVAGISLCLVYGVKFILEGNAILGAILSLLGAFEIGIVCVLAFISVDKPLLSE